MTPTCLAGLALAHGIPGVKPIKPGQAFTVGSMRGLVRGPDGHYARAPIDLYALHDGSAMAFLVADPITPGDVVEAKQFEEALKHLPNTHGFVVLPPPRSTNIDSMAKKLDQSGLTIPVIVDDRDVFPYVFRHGFKLSPRYELFDRSQVLVIENAVHLSARTADGESIGQLLTRLDRGLPVTPLVLSAEEQAGYDPRE